MRLSTSLSALGLAACALAHPDITTTDENGIRSIPVCVLSPSSKSLC
jgi:lectin, mannose-binding 2